MSFHIEGPWLSTTGKKKGPAKWASADHKRKAEQADIDWKELQKRWKIDAEDRKQKRGLTKEIWKPEPTTFRGSDQPRIASLPFTGGSCTLPEQKVYTGNNILGIATLHKSNAVPVFSKQEALDIAKMRR